MYRLILLLFTCLVGTAYGETLVDAVELARLEGAEQWPVVDVREIAERSGAPIPGAFEESAEFTGPILVIASSDDEAQISAVAIEKRFPGVKAYAVLGGVESLKRIRQDLRQTLGDDNMPSTYNIPSDTCQPGEPLQTFSKDSQ
jgi:rhodanese-related sulfurtransferase